jgi:hypothetical protein
VKFAPLVDKKIVLPLAIAVGALLSACGDDDNGGGNQGGSGGTTGGSGPSGGSGGTTGGTGPTGGSGGATGGTGPTGGSGGATGGGGGATGGGGAGGATGGTGGAGGAGGGGGAGGAGFEAQVLFTFDFPDDTEEGWVLDPDLPSTSTIEIVDEDRDAANTTPGALRFTANFPDYAMGASTNVSTVFFFGPPDTGTNTTLAGATTLHFWLRLVSPVAPAGSVVAYQPFIQGGNASGFANNYGFITTATIVDNDWHEYTLDVAGSAYISDVWRIGLQIIPIEQPANPPGPDAGVAGPDAGIDAGVDAGAPMDAGSAASAPEPVVVDIDYIFVD